VVSGAAADGASACTCAYTAGHVADGCLDGSCQYAARPAAQQAPTGASSSAMRKGVWNCLAGGLCRGVWPELVPTG
jgi:hypothetical protein